MSLEENVKEAFRDAVKYYELSDSILSHPDKELVVTETVDGHSRFTIRKETRPLRPDEVGEVLFVLFEADTRFNWACTPNGRMVLKEIVTRTGKVIGVRERA